MRYSRTTLSIDTLGVREAESMHKRKQSALAKCPLSKIWVLHTHLYMHVGRETPWQKSRIYNAESFNSQQSESFDIKWLTYVFCITVSISFNVCVQVA